MEWPLLDEPAMGRRLLMAAAGVVVGGFVGSLLAGCAAPGDGLEPPILEARGSSTPAAEPTSATQQDQDAPPAEETDRDDGAGGEPAPPTMPPDFACTLPGEFPEPNDAALMPLERAGACGSLTLMNDVDVWVFTAASTRTRVELVTTGALAVSINGPGVKVGSKGPNLGPFVFRPNKAGQIRITLSKAEGNDVRYRINVVR